MAWHGGDLISKLIMNERVRITSDTAQWSAPSSHNVPPRVVSLFKKWDSSGDERLTLPEFQAAIKEFFPNLPAYVAELATPLFEEHAVEMVLEPGMTLQRFNEMWAVFLFHNFDKNADGHLSLPEASKALEFMSPTRLPIREAIAKVRSFDVNQDKVVDLDEFRAMYVATMAGENPQPTGGDPENVPSRVVALFRKFDSSGDERLTLEEMSSALQEFFPKLPQYSVDGMPALFDEYSCECVKAPGLTLQLFNQMYNIFLFKYFDKNDNGTLDMNETSKALEFMSPTRLPVREAIAKVRGFDANNDGVVDPSEFAQMYAALMCE
eukprot:CAMPEP_0119326586 /NCGR_PEP_ID=MMETSP1333-20130426/68726_1 /TAXON_ID=418940 /ORGANISM="Scyphosphaera apsteinii, Strain RCC1455" /LENGTH=322 /DNA_ID=CAMNT_0007334925 /DNA_START=57 /DNA_END=1025 /DNA_ORIENTATION=-